MNFKTILKVEEFKNRLQPLSRGNQGRCYLETNSNTVFKFFEDWEEENFNDFSKEQLLQFNDIKVKTFIFPDECLYLNNRVIGYTSRFILGTLLYEIDPLTVDLNNFLEMLKIAIEDIKYITKQGVNVYDIMYNIMLGNGIYVIDTVEYTREQRDYEYQIVQNIKGFNLEIIRFLIDGYFDELIECNKDLLKMYKSKGINISVVDFIITLKQYISYIIGHEINTLGEARELINKNEHKRLYLREEKLLKAFPQMKK